MKRMMNDALRCNRKAIAICRQKQESIKFTWLINTVIITGLLLAGCKKESNEDIAEEHTVSASRAANSDPNVLNDYTGLSTQTAWELQQARAATAKYRQIKNALKDGYADIGVVVPMMGHHYMNATLVDASFNPRQPEILIYNKHEDGSFELVAVEYAVPLTFPRPEGFTGAVDIWDDQSGLPLWLLHAWVWSYNSDGVFNPTNPLVHTH